MHLDSRQLLSTSLFLASLAGLASAQSANVLWQDVRDGIANADDQHNAVVATADGGVVLCGVTYEEFPPSSGQLVPRTLVRSLAANGQVRWTRVYSTGVWGAAVPTRIALQPSGRVVVGGTSDFGEDWFVAAYEPNGTLAFEGLWDLNS
ncbi:MAG: hypothetical protein NTV21_18245, partial [Planctomycetota bacterium]|nr:hypothetical protein [Planctomycetota bacterium]